MMSLLQMSLLLFVLQSINFRVFQELVAEDEFSVNGELIYSPPPLDEVWLSEPEHQDKRERCKPNVISMKNANAFKLTKPQYLLLLLIL